MNVHPLEPVVSVIILNWNAAQWIPRCLESLRQQTIFPKVEIIFTDNASSDGSEKVARDCMAGWSNGKIVQTGGNFGFGGGCNRGAAAATGKYLFFVNPDIWLEPACLEELAAAGDQNHATAVASKILDYSNDSVQWWLDDGFDIFGSIVNARPGAERQTSFCASTFAFVRADAFQRVGGFDEEFFLYGEESDLAWRIWISGGKVVAAPKARLHHRGEAAVNPKGGEKITEFRTSERKRFYANRNHMLALLQNTQHILLITVVVFAALLLLEGIFWMLIKGRWALMKTTCLEPLADCWRLRGHVRIKRRQVKWFRRHGDFWMLRFFCWRLGRWGDLKKLFKFGLPKIS
jgi:GT2 family glycosyltransferase